MRRCCVIGWLLVACWSAGVPAPAAVLYSNFGPDDEFLPQALIVRTALDGRQDWAWAAPFSFSGEAARLESIELAANFNRGASRDLLMALVADDGGVPGAVIEQFQLGPLPGEPEIMHLASAARPTLDPETLYWVTAIAPAQSQLQWFTGGAGALGMALQVDGDPWTARPQSPRASLRVSGVSETGPLAGDMNGDGALNADDIAPFMMALSNRGLFDARHVAINADQRGDVNGDGAFDHLDIDALAAMISTPGLSAPEPAAHVLLFTAGVVLVFARRRFISMVARNRPRGSRRPFAR